MVATKKIGPAPQMGTDNAAMPAATAVTSTSPGRSQVSRPSLMANIRTMETQQVSDKLAILGTVKQRLAEAADLFKAGEERRDEATAIADKAGASLYQAQAGGVISKEETSSILGDIFGYKPKTDGTPGKTPAGQGEAIRKRVVRAVQAEQYVSGEDVTAFFDGLPEAEVNAILTAIKNGTYSLWTAYDKFAELKRDHTTRTEAAFDPRKIAALFDALTNNGGKTAAQAFVNVPGLVAAYAALLEAVNVVDELAAGMVAANDETDEAEAA